MCHFHLGEDERALECLEGAAGAGSHDARDATDRIRAADRAMESAGLDFVRDRTE